MSQSISENKCRAARGNKMPATANISHRDCKVGVYGIPNLGVISTGDISTVINGRVSVLDVSDFFARFTDNFCFHAYNIAHSDSLSNDIFLKS